MEKDIKLGKGNSKDVPLQIDVEQNEQVLKSITFGEFSTVWFYGEYSRRVGYATVRKNKYYLEKHVLPHFKDKDLSEITTTDIEKFYAQKRERYSESTIYGVFSFLTALFRAAVEKGILDEHPIKGTMKMMKRSKQTFVPWSTEEIIELLKAAEVEGSRVMYEFVLCTGIRLGELLALSWDEIDFDKQTVTIKKNVTSIGNGKEQIEQIRSGIRTIALPPHLLLTLQKHKEEQYAMKGQLVERFNELNLVFPKRNGEIQNPSTVRGKFYRLIDKANVRKITFHDLRKMHATLLFRAGVSCELIKVRLGHKRLETTLNRFIHIVLNGDTNLKGK